MIFVFGIQVSVGMQLQKTVSFEDTTETITGMEVDSSAADTADRYLKYYDKRRGTGWERSRLSVMECDSLARRSADLAFFRVLGQDINLVGLGIPYVDFVYRF